MTNQMTKRVPFQEPRKRIPQKFFPTHEIGDGTDTDHYMEPDAQTNSEQLSPTNGNPRCTNYDLRHNPKPNCNEDCR